ncbi:hypothetical protein HD554DRAFT_2129884 [Boletus coccyginus]|nr:hypothetical protein HD554DRAFT_2129884 [Boletus coccyginus]
MTVAALLTLILTRPGVAVAGVVMDVALCLLPIVLVLFLRRYQLQITHLHLTMLYSLLEARKRQTRQKFTLQRPC